MRQTYYRLHDAPDSIPRPRRDAHGRALSLALGAVICKHGHGDEALAWVLNDGRGAHRGRWRCLACRNVAARRSTKRRKEGAPPAGNHQVPYEATPPAGGWTMRNPFDFTRVRLEQEWGPYRTWTMAQHREHTRRLYHLLGWGDEAITASTIGRHAPSQRSA